MYEFEFFKHAYVSSYPELIFYVNKIGFDENSIAFWKRKSKISKVFQVKGKNKCKNFLYLDNF